jgi:hypothetical protein
MSVTGSGDTSVLKGLVHFSSPMTTTSALEHWEDFQETSNINTALFGGLRTSFTVPVLQHHWIAKQYLRRGPISQQTEQY